MIAKVAVQIGPDSDPTYRIGVEVEVKQDEPALAAVEAAHLSTMGIAQAANISPEQTAQILTDILSAKLDEWLKTAGK